MSAPRPDKRPVDRTRHGHTVTDNYVWLLDVSREDEDVLDHLRAENSYVDEVLGHTGGLQETLFEEIKSRVQETDLSVPSRRGPWWYYARTAEGAQYPIFCRVDAGDAIDPPDPDDAAVREHEQVLLDANVEAGDGDYFSLGVFNVSNDHTVLAWAADTNGSETFTLRFRDLDGARAGEDRDTVVDGIYYSSAWSADGAHFFYTRPDDAMRPHQVWRHELGTGPADDVLAHQEDDERFFCEIGATKDEEWLVLSMGSAITSEERVCPADDVDAGFTTVVARRQGIEYGIEHLDGTFYALTNDDALDFRVLAAAVDDAVGSTDFSSWSTVRPHRAGVRIEDFDVLRSRLLFEERTEAITRVVVRDLTTGDEFELDRPEEVSTVGLAGNGDLDHPQLRYSYTSMITPATVIDLDLATGERHVRKQQPVLGGYEPSDYVTRRLWATAADGTEVPISLVHRADRTEPGPTLLYGYGSYEISMDPGFSSARLSLLERGWAFAVGHPRGGGEMGRGWYEDGKFAAKTNTFDDFVACGRRLIEDGVASPDALAIRGGSAGGLLMGAALNRAPELWAAVVAEVPFVDALNTILDPSLPLTVIEWEEWGNPIESAEIYEVMAGYSPYENLPEVAMPPVLATTGLHDPRVGYWEPAKWVARLRDVADRVGTPDAPAGGPFLLRTEMGAGHGGPSGRYDAWRDEALVFAFLLDRVG